MNKRRNKCVCGNDKDTRAKLCLPCSKNVPRKGKASRYDICTCGKTKCVRGKVCDDCARAFVKSRRAQRRVCVCGAVKGEKSSVCVDCYRKAHAPVLLDRQVCQGCERELDSDAFYKRTDGRSLRSLCIACSKVHNRRNNILSKCKKYGVDEARAIEIAALTSIECQICGDSISNFHIDHCHKTEKFRGLLCANCNSGIGLLKEDCEVLRRAILYLDSFGFGVFND